MPASIAPKIKGKIHNEYITTDCSLRSLAKKYHLSINTVARWSKEEFWPLERQQLKAAAEEEAKNHSGTDIDQYKKLMADRAKRISSAADRLLDKINMLLDLDEPLCPKDLKSISSTLLDLKMIHNIKDEHDDGDDGDAVNVKLAGSMDDWAG